MLRYLLLQVRDASDPMRSQEVECFARALESERSQIREFDLLSGAPSASAVDAVDIVLLGGSGDYSVARGGPWLEEALLAMRRLHDESKPTFASCWGFQAMARAMGGVVVNDPARAELGTLRIQVADAGRDDPVFGPHGGSFHAPIGHEDTVDRLPEGAVLLAHTGPRTPHAYRFEGKPIYCTQFHPELGRTQLLERLRQYPKYVEQIAGVPFDEFARCCIETDGTEELLRRFVRLVSAARIA